MAIRVLPVHLVNQIAAGEVIERPASVIKELVENAIDAGATQIDVKIRDGGRSFLSVTDNGSGMDPDDLQRCVERHATSKLPDEDLFHILTLGFRGEALPSIAAISRTVVSSRTAKQEMGWKLEIAAGMTQPLAPTSMMPGTKIEVSDLFFATPARLKFLKTVQTETHAIQDWLYRIALAYPHVGFNFSDDKKTLWQFPAGITLGGDRLERILHPQFLENALPVDETSEGYHLSGWLSVPTFHRSTAQGQFFYINGRFIRDKLLSQCLRLAYDQFLPRDRFPYAVLFLALPPEGVDMNVHPAKTEVRFQDPQRIRDFLLTTLKKILKGQVLRASTKLTADALQAFHVPVQSSEDSRLAMSYKAEPSYQGFRSGSPRFAQTQKLNQVIPLFEASVEKLQMNVVHQTPLPNPQGQYLGEARCQLHKTYIVAETETEMFLVDQHAAHERIVLEALKSQHATKNIKRQALLVPEVVTLTSQQAEVLNGRLSELEDLGILIEPFGPQTFLVREIPVILVGADVPQLLSEIVDDLTEIGTSQAFSTFANRLFATLACHNSIRSGRELSISEMNALLRQMEETPSAGQCNHGRPTFIKLHKNDIERLFERG